MSCKRRFNLQLTHLFYFSLFLIFTSCSKDKNAILEEPPVIPIPETGENFSPYFLLKKNQNALSQVVELRNVRYVLSMEKHIRDLTMNTFFATYFYPQLRGFTNLPIADTRTGCPTSSLSSPSGGPQTLILEYLNCSTFSGTTYDGTITVIIDGVLDNHGTTISINLGDNFMVDDGILDGSLSMIYDSGTDRYNITGLCLSNTANGIDETKVAISPGGFGGQIGIQEVTANTDPTGLIDDNFIYEAAMLEVTCPDPGTGEESVVLDVFINTEILFNIQCGVPQDGEVALELDAMPYATIDFAHPNILGTGECNNQVAVFLASDPSGQPEIITIE